ncbi:MAG: hypothetical protein ABIR05_00650 [Luteimonas sp.]
MLRSTKTTLFALAIAMLALPVACKRDPNPTAVADAATQATAKADAASRAIAAPTLDDVVERDPRYIVGISYPPVARQHPGLGRLLKAYADTAYGELMQAVTGMGDGAPTAPYDLSLQFSQKLATPDIIVIAANGSSYTGGAHGNPLVARFVWLPRQSSQLTIRELVTAAGGWQTISDAVREQLRSGLAAQVDSDGPTPGERAERVSNGARMIDDGTTPDPANFDQFEPVLAADGKIKALRFVFPPYQVGPYSDGVQSALVPASVLLPIIAAKFRPLFEAG